MKREHLQQHGAEVAGVMSTVAKRFGTSVSDWQGVSVYSRVDPAELQQPATVCVHMSDCGFATYVRLSPASAVQLARNLLAAVDQVERLVPPAGDDAAVVPADRAAVPA